MSSRMLVRNVPRHFSTSSPAAVSFWSYFDLLKSKKQQKPEPEQSLAPAQETTQESGKLANVTPSKKSEGVAALDYTKLEVIGLPEQLTKEEVKERLGNFKVEKWLNNTSKITEPAQLDKVLLKSWRELSEDNKSAKSVDEIISSELSDINIRFQFWKKVQQYSGHRVSDLILTQATSVKLIRDHYIRKVLTKENLNYNENLPDALFLEQDSFKDLPNVVVEMPLKQREIKKKYNKLLKQANEHKEQELQKAFSS